ncbi:MAG: hypothetical protein ABI867_39120 [Kofleriaceae bacterium]
MLVVDEERERRSTKKSLAALAPSSPIVTAVAAAASVPFSSTATERLVDDLRDVQARRGGHAGEFRGSFRERALHAHRLQRVAEAEVAAELELR